MDIKHKALCPSPKPPTEYPLQSGTQPAGGEDLSYGCQPGSLFGHRYACNMDRDCIASVFGLPLAKPDLVIDTGHHLTSQQ